MNAINPVADDDDANMGLKARYAFTKLSNSGGPAARRAAQRSPIGITGRKRKPRRER